MKLQLRILFSTLIVIILALTLFGSILLSLSFTAQFALKRQDAENRLASAVRSVLATYTNYALQNIRVDESQYATLLLGDQADIELTAIPSRMPGRVWLSGKTLYAQKSVSLSGAWHVLTVSLDINAVYTQFASLLRYYRALYALAALLIAFVMLMLSRHIVKPLIALSGASKALAEGAHHRRAQITGQDEIGELARAFNAMADSLTDQLSRQERFINDLTHEMKTPLTAIIGHADNIRSGRLAEEEVLLSAQTILKEGKRFCALSDAMTEWILLKNVSVTGEEFALSLACAGALNAFSVPPFANRVRLSPDCKDAMIYGNRPLITSLIINLIKNALNAGAQTVTIHCEPIPPANARVTVVDDGCGMDEQAIKRITEPFYRVDKARSRVGGGVGLGLTLCKEIAVIHRGTLTFESAPGIGTKAIVELIGKGMNRDA